MIEVWNENMKVNFHPGWVSCLDESMSPWVNKLVAGATSSSKAKILLHHGRCFSRKLRTKKGKAEIGRLFLMKLSRQLLLTMRPGVIVMVGKTNASRVEVKTITMSRTINSSEETDEISV
jgi:hypothetical protein